jgi:FemAB-related protein (PEP-CTERM system-associated)
MPALSARPAVAGEVQSQLTIRTHNSATLASHLPWLEDYVAAGVRVPLSRHPAWLLVLERALGHTPVCLEAVQEGKTRGILPLAYVHSWLFGRFLVSAPYLNYGGVLADDSRVAALLIDRAVELADQLNVRYLELRQETAATHPKLTPGRTDKVHMRLGLPPSPGMLWDEIPSKVRNQVRKALKSDLTVAWGGPELVSEFQAVFSHNMRDLGTPTYGKKLFAGTLAQFPDRTEICVVRAGRQPVAAGLLLHGWGVTEVPSASSLRSFNPSCANMLLYWKLLERATERGQAEFDFGRSSQDSSTFRFKKQWGARPAAAEWQCYARTASPNDMSTKNPRYDKVIRLWKRLPVWLTRLLGPRIVRGIP